jgi:hypothetical protein
LLYQLSYLATKVAAYSTPFPLPCQASFAPTPIPDFSG